MSATVGDRIAEWRRQRGMSQSALAVATGVSRSAVAQWETDRAGQVSANLSRIARALDVSVELLLHGDSPAAPAGLLGDELALLRLYRTLGRSAQADLLREARRLAQDAPGEREPTGLPDV